MLGADLYTVPELDAPILAGASSPPRRWSWRRNGLVRGLWIGTVSGVDVDVSGLFLDIQVKSQHFAGDGTQVRELNAMACCGNQPNWYRLDIPVHANDPWILTVRNGGPNTIVPIVQFFMRPEAE